MKVVVNRCHGGFCVSRAVYDALGFEWSGFGTLASFFDQTDDTWRTDPKLIAVVEELGSSRASGQYASLEIIDIPGDIEWYIDDDAGYETIHEKHRIW